METTYCRTFQIDHESSFGEIHKIELKPDGGNIAVTNENRGEFVTLYIDWIVNKSVENQFGYFKKGFERVVSGDAIKVRIREFNKFFFDFSRLKAPHRRRAQCFDLRNAEDQHQGPDEGCRLRGVR